MMYPKFIEVHLAKDDCLASLNISHIVGTADFDNGEGYIVKTSDRGDWIVRESYEELKQMITDSGYLIRKQDPRLDLTHPLSLEDLKDMIGEPVWCTNVDSWMLVKSADDLSVRVVWVSGNTSEYSGDDLRKFPIYGVKVVGGQGSVVGG